MIYNLTKNRVLARNPVFAKSLNMRMRGMIGRRFTDFDAMVFERCNNIHTFFMSIPLDVIFVNIENRICDIRKEVKPWNFIVRSPVAVTVIEMPSGATDACDVEVQDVLDLNAELTENEIKKRFKKDILAASAEPIIPFNESIK